MVADLNRPDMEAEPDVLGFRSAGYSVPAVGSLLEAVGDDPSRRSGQHP